MATRDSSTRSANLNALHRACTHRSWLRTTLGTLGALCALWLAACGDDAVTTGGPSEGGECTDDSTCDSFVVRCNNGDTVLTPGCRTASGCRTQSELPASVCGGEGFESVTPVSPMEGEAGTMDPGTGGSGGSGGSSGSSGSTCRDNSTVLTLPNGMEYTFDCVDTHQVCKADDAGSATCVDPTLGDACFNEGSVACTTDGQPAVCQDLVMEAIDVDCLSGGCNTFLGTKNVFVCGEGEDSREYAVEGTPCDVGPEKASCTPDRTAMLGCRDNRWTVIRHCDPGACVLYTDSTTLGGITRCSYGGYAVGDECAFEGSGVACSTDRTQLLECSGGKIVVREACGVGSECRRGLQNGDTILHCAPSGYVVGDLCHFPDGALLCDATQTAVLVCQGEMMEMQEACAAGTTCQPGMAHGTPIGECQ